jgi:hypothetical protein
MAGGEKPVNPLSRIPPPKVPGQVVSHHTPEIIKALPASVNTAHGLAVRDRAIILTLCGHQPILHSGGNMTDNRSGAINIAGDVLGVPLRAGASPWEPPWGER